MPDDSPLSAIFAAMKAEHDKQHIRADSAWERVGAWLDSLNGEGLYCLGQIINSGQPDMFTGQALAIARAKGIDPSTGEPVTGQLERPGVLP